MSEKHESTFGRHCIVDFYGVDFDLLNDEELMNNALKQAAILTGATVLKTESVKFPIQGLSSVCVLAESHITSHTSPEFGYGAFDIFTCSQDINPEIGVAHLVSVFKPKRHKMKQLIRGTGELTEVNC